MEFEKLKIVNKKHPNGIVALKGHIAICNDEFDVACVYTDFTGFEKYAKLIKEAPEMFEMLKECVELQKEHIKSGCNTRFINIDEVEQLLNKITK